jgi:hypothetical protein
VARVKATRQGIVSPRITAGTSTGFSGKQSDMTKRRNRQSTPRILPTGETLATAQSDPVFTMWAQVSPDFRRVLTMLTNERVNALNHVPMPLKQASEAMMLGIMLGWEACLSCAAKLPGGPEKAAPAEPEPTYPGNQDEKDFESLNT